MSDHLRGLEQIPTMGGGLLLLVAVLVVVFVLVMSRNYRDFLNEPLALDLLPDEDEVDRLEVRGRLSCSRMVLTDRRLFIQRIGWFLSRRTQAAVALEDVQLVRWRVSINIPLLVAGLVLLLVLRPIGLLLVMAGIESTTCGVSFLLRGVFGHLGGHGATAWGRAHLPDFARFYQRAHLAWARLRRVPDGTPTVADRPPVPMPVLQGLGFEWSRLVWVALGVAIALAVVQRCIADHVSFDHVVFAPLYLALPVAAARSSPREASWVALLSFTGIWSVKFPGLFQETGGAHLSEAVVVLVGLLAIATTAALLIRHVGYLLAPAALLLWPACLLVTAGAEGVSDARLPAIVLLSMAWAMLLGMLGVRYLGDGRATR